MSAHTKRERIADHGECAERWRREQSRTKEDETEDAPLLPEHMCQNEMERHSWRAEVLGFVRDHIEAQETYRLGAADLEFGELFPAKPAWMEQDEYEERNGVRFQLEQLATTPLEVAGAPDLPVDEILGHMTTTAPEFCTGCYLRRRSANILAREDSHKATC